MKQLARKLLRRLHDKHQLYVGVFGDVSALYHYGTRVNLPYTPPDWPWHDRVARWLLSLVAR